jgi:GNAT superfamily N-acetyltransferase
MSRRKLAPGRTATVGQRPTVVYRHLGDEVAPDCEPNWNRQVVIHAGRGFPVGLAWVLAPPPGARPQIKFLLVADAERRKGIATRLIEASCERWPDAELSPPISAPGLLPAWHTSGAVALARSGYETKDWAIIMPILADALQDADCNDDAVLSHCRNREQTHVRGCWVVDAVLGKT